MTSSLDDVFATALEKGSAEERSAYLDEACRDDPALRRQVERMLAAHSKAGSFLESPALEIDATLVHSAAEKPGTVIGRYKLLEEIAEGGMGVVYMAEQREPVRRKVALKIVKPGMDTREVIARFEAERQALAMMDHPNIAKVFDAGETESGRSYFVMELVRGMPLTEYCDKNELTIQERLALFVQVCQTIHHAHQKGIIHRDIKPSNVMVTHRDGTPVPKVIDFGIAKALHGSPLSERTLFTRYGQMIGTPLYMSPEQAEMSDLDIDTRSDIYSLGVMLYELLTGSTPFDLEEVKKAAFDEVRRMIREDEPPPPSTRVSTLKAEDTEVFSQRKTDPLRLGSLLRRDLDWIVMKALEKDRSRRYDTASDLARDVERYLAGEPVTAAPPSRRYRLGKWVRRHRKIVSSVAVFLIGSAVAAGVIMAAMLVVRWRDKSGREATVETSQPSTVNISKDGSVSIVPVRESEKTKTVAPDDSAFDAKKSRERQERFARESGRPLEITNSIGMKLVLIPSGEFEMGSPSDFIVREVHEHSTDGWYNGHLLAEAPRHHVRITHPFYFGVYDVTQDEYERVMGENPSAFSPRGKAKAYVAGLDTKRHPVDSLTWYHAAVFCRRLSELPAEKSAAREYCLPTAAEWEYACRAGNPGRYYFSAVGKSATREHDECALVHFAWFNDEQTDIHQTHPVGLKPPNAWGLYDMHGNVYQWCCDGPDYRQAPVDDPKGPEKDTEYEVRGGSVWAPAWLCRSAFRLHNPPTYRREDLGMRVCLAVARAPTRKLAAANDDMLSRGLEYQNMGQPEKALAAFSKAMKEKPTLANDIGILQKRGRVALRLARWHDAAADFTKIIALSDDKQWARLRVAPVYLLAGDETSYRRACREMLAEASANHAPIVAEQAAKACLLLPVTGDDLLKADRLAAEALKRQPDVKWDLLVQGIADCRAGRNAAAVERLDQTIEKNAATRDDSLDAVAHLFLSLAHQGQGHREEAKQHLESGRQLVLEEARAIRQRGFRGSGWDWDTWTTAFYIYAEAVHLVEGTPDAKVRTQLDAEIRAGGK